MTKLMDVNISRFFRVLEEARAAAQLAPISHHSHSHPFEGVGLFPPPLPPRSSFMLDRSNPFNDEEPAFRSLVHH